MNTPRSTPRKNLAWPIITSRNRPNAIERPGFAGPIKPHECPAFGTGCTPEHPLGATMVSSEGACAAYYRYRRMPDLIGAK